MKLDRDGRRTVAQFLNGMAVAIIGIGAVTPVVAGHASLSAFAAILLATGLSLVAVWMARR